MSWQNKPQPHVFGDKSKPDASAQVEIESGGSKGFLGPRMTTAERLAIPTPAVGLQVYDTDTNSIFIFNGTIWFQPGGIVGPGTTTDNAVMRWDGVTGSAAQDSVVTIDDVGYVQGVTELDVDNIKIDGNEITSTDTDGDIVLTPDGNGKVVISKDLQVLGTTTTVDSDTLEVADANITINKDGNQASADTLAGLTVEMSDATDATVKYDSSLESKWKLGEDGSEVEVATTSGNQDLTNKELSNTAAVPAGLSLHQQSTTLATKPWPNMTQAEIDAIATPLQGWVVYNTTQNELNIYDGADWIPYNIGVYFMIENGYKRDFSSSNLGTTFEAIKTITGGTLKAMNVTNNSGNELLIRVDSGVEMLIAPGDAIQIGYRGDSGDVVEIATVSGTATEGNVYINFLGV